MNDKTRTPKFRPTEVAVIVLVLAVLLAVLLPMVQRAREAARRTSCSNNFKQIGIAMHNYHSAYQVLPTVVYTQVTATRGKAFPSGLPWAVQSLLLTDVF